NGEHYLASGTMGFCWAWQYRWCRGPESNWLRPPFQGGALPVSYPGTGRSVNFRGGGTECQTGAGSGQRREFYVREKEIDSRQPNNDRPITRVGKARAPRPEVFTIGHSTRTIEEFTEILRAYGVQLLVDVRTVPKSRRVPHFNSGALADSLNK